MAVPPPPDWVDMPDPEYRRDPILDADHGRVTRSIPRVILEGEERAADWPEHRIASDAAAQMAATTYRYGVMADAQRRWREVSFSLFRRDQLLALIGFVVLSLVVAYALQRGPLAQDSGSVLLGGPSDQAPAGPGLVSDSGQDDPRSSSRRMQGNPDRSSADFAANATTPNNDQSELGDAPNSSDSPKLFAPKNTSGTKKQSASANPTPSTFNDSTSPDPGLDITDSTVRVADDGRTAVTSGDDGNDGAAASTPSDASSPDDPVDDLTSVRFESCAEASAAGAAPIPFGAPGYRLSLDADNDGLACENGPLPEVVPVEPDDDRPTTTATTSTTTSTVTTNPTSSIPISTTTAKPESTTTTSAVTTTSTTSGVSTISTPTTPPVTTLPTTTSTTERTTTTEQPTTTSTTERSTTTSTSVSTTASTVGTTQTTVSTTTSTTERTTTTEQPTTTEATVSTEAPTTTEPAGDGPGSDDGQVGTGPSGPG